jgi:hypothetical protein
MHQYDDATHSMKKVKVYVPGLLSLLLLLPLLVYQLSRWGIFDKEYVMEVTWYSPVLDSRYSQELLPSKEYVHINFTGNPLTDKTKIEYVKILIDEMVSSFDTTRGVHIVFTDTAKYESFIEILNFCNNQDGLAYAPHESDFWIFNRIKSEEHREILWRGSCIVMTSLNEPEDQRNFAWALSYSVNKRYWPIGLLFILLAISSLKRRPGG